LNHGFVTGMIAASTGPELREELRLPIDWPPVPHSVAPLEQRPAV
jgi:hypothetical protein